MSRNLTAAVLMLMLMAAVSMPGAAATLKIATIAPDGTRWMQELRSAAETITQRTAGRVQFRFYPGGVMGNEKIVLRKIRVGQLQGGALTAGGLAEIYPDSLVYGLPFLFRSYDEVDYVRQRLDPDILQGLETRGFVSFGLGEGGFAYLMSKRPIRGIDDLKDCKVWVPEDDSISRAAFEAVGISPIPLPLTDVLTGLQTGLVDTIGASQTGAIALQWHTHVQYLMDMPLLYLDGALVVQRAAMQALAPGDQAIVRDELEAVFRQLNQLSREDDTAAREALRSNGITVVRPTLEETGPWRDAVAAAMDRLSTQGVYSAALLQRLRGYLADYRKLATSSR